MIRGPWLAEAVTGKLCPQSGQVNTTWSPPRVLAIDPVGITNASATNSFSIRTRTTTKTIVSKTSRDGSPWECFFFSRPMMKLKTLPVVVSLKAVDMAGPGGRGYQSVLWAAGQVVASLRDALGGAS